MDDVRVLALIGGEGDEARRVTAILRELDPGCATVSSCEEAAAVYRGVAPHVIVLDVGGSGVDRSALSAALSDAAEGSLPPILSLHDSGDVEPDSVEPNYLYRPFAAATLVAVTGDLARRHQADVGNAVLDAHAHVPATASTEVLRPHPLYEKAREYIGAVLDSVRADESPDIHGSLAIAEEIHTELLQSNTMVRKVLEPHGPFDLASHSVNVAVIAGKISLGLADPPDDVVSTIQAGLVHDIGMARLPQALIGKAGTLTEEELTEVRKHPQYGYEVLEPFGPGLEWLARVVLQEHERANGQGYPMGIAGTGIDPVAKIVAVADVFEALSHPRTYRSPHATFDALEQVVGMQDEYFEPHVVSALVHEISSFPPDSYVQLSTGEICQVVATNHENLMRPRVVVLWNSDWIRLDEPHAVDLVSNPAITVTRSLLETELPIG